MSKDNRDGVGTELKGVDKNLYNKLLNDIVLGARQRKINPHFVWPEEAKAFFVALGDSESVVHTILKHAEDEEFNALIDFAFHVEEINNHPAHILRLLQAIEALDDAQQARIFEDDSQLFKFLHYAKDHGEPVDRQLISMISKLKHELIIESEEVPLLVSIAKEHRTTTYIMLDALMSLAPANPDVLQRHSEQLTELIKSALTPGYSSISINGKRVSRDDVIKHVITSLKIFYELEINPLKNLNVEEVKILATMAAKTRNNQELGYIFAMVSDRPNDVLQLFNTVYGENGNAECFNPMIWRSLMNATGHDHKLLQAIGASLRDNTLDNRILDKATPDDWKKLIDAHLDPEGGSVRRLLGLMIRRVDLGHDFSKILSEDDIRKIIEAGCENLDRAKVLLQLEGKQMAKGSLLRFATDEQLKKLRDYAASEYPEGLACLLSPVLVGRISPEDTLSLFLSPVKTVTDKKESALFYLVSEHPEAVPVLLKNMMALSKTMSDDNFMSSCALIISKVYRPGITLQEQESKQNGGATNAQIEKYNQNLRRYVLKDITASCMLCLLVSAYSFSHIQEKGVQNSDEKILDAYIKAKEIFNTFKAVFVAYAANPNLSDDRKKELRDGFMDVIRRNKDAVIAADPKPHTNEVAGRITWFQELVNKITEIKHAPIHEGVFKPKTVQELLDEEEKRWDNNL